MKRCQQCNVDYPDDLSFCLSCGSTLKNPARTQYSTKSNTGSRETYVRCTSCKNFIRTDASVCEHCGANLGEESSPTSSRPKPTPSQIQPQEQYSAAAPYQQTIASTVGDSLRDRPPSRATEPTSPGRIAQTAPSLPGFESYNVSNTSSSSFRWWHGAIVLFFVLVFAGGLGAGAWWWWSSRNSATHSNVVSSPTPGSITDVKNKSASADDELKALRERRITARPADGNKIVTDLQDAEKKYPTDYRFPYERAKLSIKGVISHHEAFEAIFLAAEKAIDNGKSEEMLSDLNSDKDGDFYKMSRGHHEWEKLEGALRSRDKLRLKSAH